MAQQEIHNTSGLPDQVKSLTLYDLAEYLGPLQQHGSEGQGYQCECPICYRNTLHLTPGVDASKAKIWCYYCHGEPRHKLKELGYGEVIDSTRHVVDHERI